jgi:hypothetical protein
MADSGTGTGDGDGDTDSSSDTGDAPGPEACSMQTNQEDCEAIGGDYDNSDKPFDGCRWRMLTPTRIENDACVFEEAVPTCIGVYTANEGCSQPGDYCGAPNYDGPFFVRELPGGGVEMISEDFCESPFEFVPCYFNAPETEPVECDCACDPGLP